MAIAFVNATSVANPNSNTSVVATKPTGVVQGHLMVAFFYAGGSGTTTVVAPSGWTQQGSTLTGTPGQLAIFTKIATSSEPSTYTFTGVGYEVVSIVAYSGTQAFDGTAVTTASSSNGTTATSGAISATGANEVLIEVFCSYGGNTFTTPSGLTLRTSGYSSGNEGMAVFEKALTATGAAGTYSSTISASDAWRTAAVLLAVGSTAYAPTGLADTEAITDAPAAQQVLARTAGDTESISDAPSAAQRNARTQADAAALSDAGVGLKASTPTPADAVGMAGATTFVQDNGRMISDGPAIFDNAVAALIHKEIDPYQFHIPMEPHVPFGPGQTINVNTFDPGTAGIRSQDVPSARGDSMIFGTDRKTPPVWGFTMNTDTYSPEDALGWVDMLAQIWDNDVRQTPGGVVPLRYNVGGRLRRVYGRPRRFTPVPDLIYQGIIHITADFQLAEDVYYDDAEQTVTVGLGAGGVVPTGVKFPLKFPFSFASLPAPRTELAVVTGSQATWMTVTIHGPITNPWVQIGSLTWGLRGTVPGGQSVTLSGQPWSQGVVLSSGAYVPGWLDPRSRLSALRMKPGNYPVTFGGVDNTGSATATVAWRPAHRSM